MLIIQTLLSRYFLIKIFISNDSRISEISLSYYNLYWIYTHIYIYIYIYIYINYDCTEKKFTVPLCNIIIHIFAARCTSIFFVPLIYLLQNFDNIAGSDLWLSLSLAYIVNKSERRNLARVYLLVRWNCMESVLSGNTSWYEKKYSRSQLRH